MVTISCQQRRTYWTSMPTWSLWILTQAQCRALGRHLCCYHHHLLDVSPELPFNTRLRCHHHCCLFNPSPQFHHHLAFDTSVRHHLSTHPGTRLGTQCHWIVQGRTEVHWHQHPSQLSLHWLPSAKIIYQVPNPRLQTMVMVLRSYCSMQCTNMPASY